ncbi:MAG: hypothetical protein Q9186_001311 [Xanthomendoza sp. 1 TL-2023]
MPARNRKSSQRSTSRFPVLQLPLELQHLIFAATDPRDVPNLRLACKTFATIGMNYLLPQAQLLFTRQSFDHLSEVSQHPVLCRSVKSLIYCVDLLGQHFDKDEWIRGLAREMGLDGYIRGSEWAGPEPPVHASDRERRFYERNLLRATDPEVRYSARQLSLGWVAYGKLWLEQAPLRNASYGKKEIIATLARFPNLKHITLSNFHYFCDDYAYFDATYKHVLTPICGDEGYSEPCGMPQLLSLIQALDRGGTALESLKAGLISWLFLDVKNEDFELMKSVFHALKSFKMAFMTG